MARPDTRAAAGPAARVCRPCADPPGLREGEAAKRGRRTAVGSRQCGVREQVRGAGLQSHCGSARWMSRGQSEVIKRRPGPSPVSPASPVPVQAAAGPVRRLLLREGVLTQKHRRRKFFISKTQSLQAIKKSTTCVRLSRPALDSEPCGHSESKAGD